MLFSRMTIRQVLTATKSGSTSTIWSKPRTNFPTRFKSTTGDAATSTSSTTSTTTTKETVPIAQTILAMTTGVLTVSAVAALVEQATSTSIPPFDPSRQRYDQSTFTGRFSKMLLACDPRLVFYTDETVRRCQTTINDSQNLLQTNKDPNIHRTLWEAQRIASAALHPDTGEKVPRPFRMSGYVPYNGPVCVAMVASSSTPAMLFLGWVNQSQNALVNYFNRNASSTMSNETLAKSYAAAVGSALFVVFGLATFVNKRFSPEKARHLLRFVAFPSSMVASSLNCYIVRSPEIDTGIPLLDEHGNNVLEGETSQAAAAKGVFSTVASRAFLQAPVFFVPPLLLSSIPLFQKIVAKNPSAAVPITTYLLLVSFGIGLPASVAIFPQISEIEVDKVEEKFRGLRDGKGERYERFYFNKGL